MATLPFPLVECRGVDALQKWAELRKRGKAEGFYPVIVGDAKDMEMLADSFELNGDQPAAILERADSMDGEDVLKIRASLEPDTYENVEVGDWPLQVLPQPIMSHTELRTGKPKAKVHLAQLPTIHSHEVPAYLRYGDWNACPSADEHVAIHRLWSAEYRAEIIAVTGDVIECTVTRPPLTDSASLKLAR